MFIFARSKFPRPLLLGRVGSILNSKSLAFGSVFGVIPIGRSGRGSMVEADNGIGEAIGAVEGNASRDGSCNVADDGRGTGMVRCFEDGVDASAAASF
jgi:hypothetical protein